MSYWLHWSAVIESQWIHRSLYRFVERPLGMLNFYGDSDQGCMRGKCSHLDSTDMPMGTLDKAGFG